MKNNEFLEVNQLWEDLINYDLFTEDELLLITDLNGYNIKTLNDAIYVRYGYRNLRQLLYEMEGDE